MRKKPVKKPIPPAPSENPLAYSPSGFARAQLHKREKNTAQPQAAPQPVDPAITIDELEVRLMHSVRSMAVTDILNRKHYGDRLFPEKKLPDDWLRILLDATRYGI